MTAQGSALIFCSSCKNLLYPESDKDKLMKWRCAHCKGIEEHNDVVVVWSTSMKVEGAELKEKELLADFASDPTAQRDPEKRCPQCQETGVACMINPLEQPTEDMSLFFACPNCRYVWKDEEEKKMQH